MSEEPPAEADQETPDPPQPTVSADNAIKAVVNASQDTAGSVPPDGWSHPDGKTVSQFLTFYPFMRFFCWLADRQFHTSHAPQTRVQRLRAQHKWLYYVCLILDVLFVLMATALLLAAAGAALYKTVWLGA